MSIRNLFGNGLWLIIGSTISNIVSYVYIFLISQSVQPEVVGVLGAIMAFQATLGVILSLGIPTGIQLYVGAARGEGDSNEIQATFLTNIIALLTINLVGTSVLMALFIANIGILQFTAADLLLVALVHILTSVSPILLALFIALLKSKIAAYAQIISSVIKIPIGLIALNYAQDIFSACSGIIASYFILDLFLIYQWRTNVGSGSKLNIRWSLFKKVVIAGRPSWIITVFTALGESIGVIVVFNLSGSVSAGLYYIAFAIASIIYIIPSSILGVLFPLLSGMSEGKDAAAATAIRLCMVITVPLTLVVFAYPEIALAILGGVYVSAAPILRMLLVGALFSSIVVGYYSYIYSEKSYRAVLVLGLGMNIVRLIIYYPLVFVASGMGAAITYTSGVLVGVIIVLALTISEGLKIEWFTFSKILIPPILISGLLIIFQIHIIIGLPLFLLLSLISYGRMKVLTKSDLLELTGVVFTPNQIETLLTYFKPIVKLIFGN